jgi:hypothetical protein
MPRSFTSVFVSTYGGRPLSARSKSSSAVRCALLFLLAGGLLLAVAIDTGAGADVVDDGADDIASKYAFDEPGRCRSSCVGVHAVVVVAAYRISRPCPLLPGRGCY